VAADFEPLLLTFTTATYQLGRVYYVVMVIWVFQLLVSPVWLRYFRFGPIEWGWRSLTYWQRQPMRLPPEQPAAEVVAA
jgi:uncharacterized protein